MVSQYVIELSTMLILVKQVKNLYLGYVFGKTGVLYMRDALKGVYAHLKHIIQKRQNLTFYIIFYPISLKCNVTLPVHPF